MPYDFAQEQIDKWTTHLWRISQGDHMRIDDAGDLQDIVDEMRLAAGLPEMTT